MTFVASKRPPRPTSSTTTSHALRAKWTSATAHMSSNSVGWSVRASACSLTSSVASNKSAAEMFSPSTRMRSSNASR